MPVGRPKQAERAPTAQVGESCKWRAEVSAAQDVCRSSFELSPVRLLPHFISGSASGPWSARRERFFVSQLRRKAEALTCLLISAVLKTIRPRRRAGSVGGVHPGAPLPFCCFSAFLLSVAPEHCVPSALAVLHSTQTDVKKGFDQLCVHCDVRKKETGKLAKKGRAETHRPAG